MDCLQPSKCNERVFTSVKKIVSNCNVIEVTLTQKQNTDCTTEFVSLIDAGGNSYPENSEFVSMNNQISRVVIDGLSTCAADAIGGGSESVITLQLVDFVAEHTEGGTIQTVAAAGDFSTRTVEGNDPFYVQPWGAVFWNSDEVSTGEYYALITVFAGSEYTLQIGTSTGNMNNSSLVAFFGDQTKPLLDGVSEYVFTATETTMATVGLRVLPNSGVDGINSISLTTLVGETVVPATCTPFVRKISDGVPSDFQPDGVTPYIVVGEIKAHCPEDGTTPTQPCEEIIQLVDIYESTESYIADLTLQSYPTSGAGIEPHPSGQGMILGTSGTDDFLYIYLVGLTIGQKVVIKRSFYGSVTIDPLTYFIAETQEVITKPVSEPMSFIPTATTHILAIYHRYDAVPSVAIESVTATAGAQCKVFLRKISSQGVTDYKLDATTPYNVQGIVGTECPSQAGCACTDEFAGVQSTIDNILTALQNPIVPPAAALLETGQPVLILSGGVGGETFTRDQIAHYGLTPSLIQASGYSSFASAPPEPSYLLNSISFVPSDTFTLAVAGGAATVHDYTFAMTANSTAYQFEEVDDFSITIPANQTVTLHMTVSLYPFVTP